jgi:hypothetical protein
VPGAEIVSVTKPQNNPELRRIAAFIVVRALRMLARKRVTRCVPSTAIANPDLGMP